MATLADAFLAEFEDADDMKDAGDLPPLEQTGSDGAEVEVKEISMDIDEAPVEITDGVGSVCKISNMVQDPQLKAHLDTIDTLRDASTRMEDAESKTSIVSHEDEQKMIVRSNEWITKIDNEISLVHKYVRDLYSTKMKELESLIMNSVDYAKVVKAIRNSNHLEGVDLTAILPPQSVMTLQITATTTKGQPLSEEDLAKVLDACDVILDLDQKKRHILAYVEARMELIAPNLTALLGSEVAAQLMGIAGGLAQLSKMPACNIQVVGQKRKATHGFSVSAAQMHIGCIAAAPVITSAAEEVRKKALRVVAAKAALMARCDMFQQDITGDTGRRSKTEVEKKIEKWLEPAPPKAPKPLPAPIEKPGKKRGGRRARKLKELLRTTDMAREKGRMAFGVAETTDDYTGEGYGMLGQSGSGHVRVTVKTKAKAPKAKRQKIRPNKPGLLSAGGAVSGLASTFAFTPVQGIELVNPDAQKDRSASAANKYFSNASGFASVSGTMTELKRTPLPGSMVSKNLPPVPKFT